MTTTSNIQTTYRTSLKLAVGLLLTISGAASIQAQETSSPKLSPTIPYTAKISDPVTHQVDISIVVTPPYHCQVLKVWIPVPQSDAAQQIHDSRFTTFPLQVTPKLNTEPVFGNKFAYFEFHNPKGAQIIRHRFQAKVANLHWNLDLRSVEDVRQWPESFKPYLQPQQLTDEKQFHTVLRQIVPKQRGMGRDLAEVIAWVNGNLTYDHKNASLQADANHAISQRRGHCSDYHGLCATMGRALGYPTRVTYGLALFPKNSPSHCKMEAFLPPHGWVSFDLSETQKMVARIRARSDLNEAEKETLAAAARQRLFAGFRENSWLLMTRGTGYELAPKASRPVRVVRTAFIEADGQPLPEPDPANNKKREFSWMTVHKYDSDKEFKMPFRDLSTLSADE